MKKKSSTTTKSFSKITGGNKKYKHILRILQLKKDKRSQKNKS